MNFYQELGSLVFGTRMKRLSDYFLKEVNKVYNDLDIKFEASWFGVFYLLDKNEEASIFEMAETLEVSHSAISQLVKNLKANNLIKITGSKDDKRMKVVSLSLEGLVMLAKIKPVWQGLESAMNEVFNENVIMENFKKIEDAFIKRDLNVRIKDNYNNV